MRPVEIYSVHHRFATTARRLSDATGTWQAFALTVALLLVWIVAGFWIGFDNMLYQFVGSNVMSAASLLLLVLLQASQNRDVAATHAKLDELVRAHQNAWN